MSVLLVLTIIVFGGKKIQAEAMKKATDWNSPSLSFFFSEQSKTELMGILPAWEVQSMTWPTESEIKSCRGIATEIQKKECENKIKEYLKDEWVPTEITSYLLPLRKWTKSSLGRKDERKADVFLCRYCIGNYLIQIMDGNWAMIITIKEMADTPPLKKDDHKNFVSNIFRTFFKGELTEMPLARQQPQNITEGGIRSGKTGLTFITDGKFTKFEAKKILSGPRMFPDSYEPRFSDEQKSK
jgi:hypothetical protein